MKEIKGNLITLAKEGKFDIIGHGCNCFATMGAGIALQIKNNFPQVYNKDLYDERQPIRKLGDYTSANNFLEVPIVALNIYSQYFPGKNFDKEAFTLALRKININYEKMHIGLPRIGCGIAGANWEEVKKIIEKELNNMEVTIVTL